MSIGICQADGATHCPPSPESINVGSRLRIPRWKPRLFYINLHTGVHSTIRHLFIHLPWLFCVIYNNIIYRSLVDGHDSSNEEMNKLRHREFIVSFRLQQVLMMWTDRQPHNRQTDSEADRQTWRQMGILVSMMACIVCLSGRRNNKLSSLIDFAEGRYCTRNDVYM